MGRRYLTVEQKKTLTTQAWQQMRRARGECARCGQPHQRVNPKTKQPTWLCRDCSNLKSAWAREHYKLVTGQ